MSKEKQLELFKEPVSSGGDSKKESPAPVQLVTDRLSKCIERDAEIVKRFMHSRDAMTLDQVKLLARHKVNADTLNALYEAIGKQAFDG